MGLMDQWSVHETKLIGIFSAISSAYKLAYQQSRQANSDATIATILCDSKSALQTIQNQGTNRDRQFIRAIVQDGQRGAEE